jgi:hypothetical protein
MFLETSLYEPGIEDSNDKDSIDDLTNRKVGKPTAAVIRRTCLFLPSVKVMLSQLVGTLFRNRIGGSRSGSASGVSIS